MRLILYTGKGGVGKTTIAAATAARSAELGIRTLVASADAAHSLGDVFERRLPPDPAEIAPGLHAMEIDARVEMTRHWGRIRDFLVSLFRHQGIDAVVAEELALLPGAEEITTLLAVEEQAASGDWDLVIVDCAPTDAALRLVTLPDVAHRSLRVVLPLLRAVSGVAAPLARAVLDIPIPGQEVFRDADDLVYRRLRGLQKRMTGDETSVRLVVTSERMVIDEARRSHTDLALFEVPCDAVVLNRLLPPDAADEEFFRAQAALQEERRREIEELFAPLPVLTGALGDDEVTGLERLTEFGRQIFPDTPPDAVLCRAPRVRFRKVGRGYEAHVPLPHADLSRLEVAVVEDELTITTGPRRRSLLLPRRVAALPLGAAKVVEDFLVVRFEHPAAASPS